MKHHAPLLIIVAMLALASASLAAVCGDPDAIATPGPEATATATSVDAAMTMPADTATPVASTAPVLVDTPVPVATPPNAPDQSGSGAMLMSGDVWVDAAPGRGLLVAFIDGIECGTGRALLLPDSGQITTFIVSIESDATRPGCGHSGSIVTLALDGRSVNELVTWQSGSLSEPVTLTVGAPFAMYYGEIVSTLAIPALRVRAIVAGVDCGTDVSPPQRGKATSFKYQLAVASSDTRAGCGVSGTPVELRLELVDGSYYDLGTESWLPGLVDSRATMDLTNAVVSRPTSVAEAPTQ